MFASSFAFMKHKDCQQLSLRGQGKLLLLCKIITTPSLHRLYLFSIHRPGGEGGVLSDKDQIGQAVFLEFPLKHLVLLFKFTNLPVFPNCT